MRPVPLALVVALMVAMGLATTGCPQPVHLRPVVFRHWQAGLANDDPKNAAVVVLAQRERYLLMNPPNAAPYTEIQVHRVVKVLSEAGFEAASAHVFLPARSRLVDLRARTLTPAGRQVTVDVAAVLADAFVVEGDEGTTRSFQFPRVEVGSILEQTSTVRRDGVWSSFSGSPVEAYPVREYHLEIVIDRFTTPDLFLDNAKVPLSLTKDDDGTQHVSFTLKNIAASSTEHLRPDDSELHPRWLYRTIEWRHPRGVQAGVTSWAQALRRDFHDLVVKEKNLTGLPKLRADRCAGVTRCLIEAAVTQTREDVVFSGFEASLDVRPIAELVSTKTANNHEKAVYLWALLRGAGVDARLAPTARRDTARLNETFPTSTAINHVLVQTKDGLWLDPSCEHCAVGELPGWSRGSRAMPLGVRGGQNGNELTTPDGIVDVVGTAAPPGLRQRVYEARLQENGDVDVVATEEASGDEATGLHLWSRTWTQKDADARSLTIARNRSEAGRSIEATPWRCDRARGVCRWRHAFRLPGWATVDGATGSLVVPLGILKNSREAWYAPSGRRLPVVIKEGTEVREVLRLTPPPGFQLDTAAIEPGEGRAEGYATSLTVAREGDVVIVTRTERLEAGRHPRTHWKKLFEASKPFRAVRTVVLRAVPASTTSPAPPPAAP